MGILHTNENGAEGEWQEARVEAGHHQRLRQDAHVGEEVQELEELDPGQQRIAGVAVRRVAREERDVVQVHVLLCPTDPRRVSRPTQRSMSLPWMPAPTPAVLGG
jgi:hypothetical protein